MRRDDWGTRNRPTINGTITELQTVQVNNNSDILGVDSLGNRDGYNISNNKTEFSGKFFGSYDPEVGIHTAAVLGGLLSILVLYVIYRTKCRKRLIKAFNICAMKYFPEEFEEMHPKSSFRERDIEKGKGLERNKSLSGKTRPSEMTRECLSKTSEHGSDINDNSGSVCGECEYDEMDHACCDNNEWLPEMEEDIERATAEWVQNVQDLDPTDKQLSSIILKIPPDLLSCPYRFREKIHSVSEYCNSDGFANISQMNQSLPLLINNERGVISPYANSKIVGNCVSRSLEYTPTASQDDLDRPKQLEVKHQSGAKVPLDICPIIKIQHYHSRSKRRLTSLHGSSSDDSSSSDPSLVPLLSMASADLMTVYQPSKHDNNISVSKNSINAPNTHTGNRTSGLETSL